MIINVKEGCDLSHWNKIMNYDQVANSVDFVILKCGGSDKGFYKDKCFDEYYEHLHNKRGIACGAYYYVGRLCISYEAGWNDAEHMIEICKGKRFEFPLYIDLESTSPKHRKGATDGCRGFCDCLESHGYYAGIYASDVSGFVDRLICSDLEKYDKWVARYGVKGPQRVLKYGVWQYTSTGHVDGVLGNVDLDFCYKDYPSIMKAHGLNGY